MTRDSAFLNDLWLIIKPHVNPKERLDIADSLVELLDEYGISDGHEHDVGFDKDLGVAITSYYSLDKDEDDEEYGYDEH